MSIGRMAVSEASLADGGEDVGKVKGPPTKRQMTALRDQPLAPEPR